MCHRGAFRENINEKCLFCKIEDNGIEHVTNKCIKFKKAREEIIKKLNNLDVNIKKLNIIGNNWILL